MAEHESSLLIVSNRLPVTIEGRNGEIAVVPSAGGLATGLRGLHDRGHGRWIGWPGASGELGSRERSEVDRQLAAGRLVPVWLEEDEVRRFYGGVSNGVLWPLFHYLLDHVPLRITDWDVYEDVNARFAEIIAREYRDGDLVWVHDYQLMLVPELLRRLVPDARIGFFLHIPFPASEVFRILPHRDRVLEGLLGADLVGFHTAAYMRHFASALLRLLGVAAEVDRVRVGGREVRLGVFPMGIDAARFGAVGADPDVIREAAALRGEDGCALLVGVDRLDYTKGIPRRLLAFEELLRLHPELHERVRLVQVAAPSRVGVDAYQEFRQSVDSLVGQVNGAYGTARWAPVHYMFRAMSEREVVALYRAADVMLVTPLRDGMNLVAKEFVASRTDEDGVLVLSEFAGAASELAEALHVNPYDVDRTAEAYHRALTLPRDERQTRMRALRRRVLFYDVDRWARTFLETLAEASRARESDILPFTSGTNLQRVLEELRAATDLVLLLDYDGTLVPFAAVPELAQPDPEILDLLRGLAGRPGTRVHVVSGRARETVAAWLGALPIGLHAEHGFWSRLPRHEWESREMPALDWRERARPILELFRSRTPGSLVEEKTVSIAWHYRMADPEFGPHQANELRLHLTEILSNEPVHILSGDKVIELRPHGIHKGIIVEVALRDAPAGARVVAIGDDQTDEDLFAALPPDEIAVHIGPEPSRAGIRLRDWRAARRFLATLVTEQRSNGRTA